MTVFPTFFDPSNRVQAATPLAEQMPVSAPAIDQFQTATNLVMPDPLVPVRMAHFPEDLYDLRPESHLVRLMAALLGDSGAGQLRKRTLITRIINILDSAIFWDLDGFYGAIFGNGRRPDEVLPVNPYTDTETPDAWDVIMATDARYRERILALAASIPLGGTVPGIRQAAEALVGAPCNVYEMWRFIDAGTNTVGEGYEWGDYTDEPSDSIHLTYPLWADVEGVPWRTLDPTSAIIGALGINTPAEVVIQPKKTYPTTPAGIRDQVLDAYTLQQVLGILSPANVVITVDPNGVEVTERVSASTVHADSVFWEVVTQVHPDRLYEDVYVLSASQRAAGLAWSDTRTIPRPALSDSHGASWSHATEVAAVEASSMLEDGTVVDEVNLQIVTYPDGAVRRYSPERGLADPQTVQSALAGASGTLIASPFVGSRTPVVTG